MSCLTCSDRDSCNEKFTKAWTRWGSTSWGCDRLRADLASIEGAKQHLAISEFSTALTIEQRFQRAHVEDPADLWERGTAKMRGRILEGVADRLKRGIPRGEIAKELGISLDYLRVIIHRAGKRYTST